LGQKPPGNNFDANERNGLLARIQELEDKCQRAEDALRTMEEYNRLLGDSAPFGIFVIDAKGRGVGANQKMMDILAWPARRDIKQINVLQYPPLVNAGVGDAFRRCMDKRSQVTSDHPWQQRTREGGHLRYHICPVIDQHGGFNGIIAFVEDVTELKQAEEAIRASETKYRLLFESSPVAMVERDAGALKEHLEELRKAGISDLPGYFDQHPDERFRCLGLIKTVDGNSAFLDLLEAQTWDEIDSGLRLANSPEFFMGLAQRIIQMVADGNLSHEREETFKTLRGNQKSILVKSLPLSGHEETLSRIVIAMVDITKRKQAEEALRASEQRYRELAMRDNLTGLYNQRYLYQSLADLIERARIDRSFVSVIFMDLDQFKTVVDTYGHLNGSRVIKEVGQTIGQTLTKPSFAVAYAGDEFVVVLPGFDSDQAFDQARKIQDRIKRQVFLQDQGFELYIQASFGIATFPHHAEDMTNLLAAADHALFAIKGSGKGGIKLHN
jgi:diguanylate cyclase (GGDEF)-like protein/PAS domain S-box-containing protein